jgi:ABC-type branched-subunit amino acid transport system substrate-binding protein
MQISKPAMIVDFFQRCARVFRPFVRGADLCVLALAVVVSGCATVSTPSQRVDELSGAPTLEDGASTSDQRRRAQEGADSAAALLEQGRSEAAARLADEIARTLPTTPAAVDAVLVGARAALNLGRPAEARAAAERVISRLPATDERRGPAIRLRFEAGSAEGRSVEALRELLIVDPAVLSADSTLYLDVAEEVQALSREQLEAVLESVPIGQPLLAPVQVAYARSLRLANRDDEARRFARAALSAGARGTDAAEAQAILEGRPLPAEGVIELAALLPLSGSPALQRVARELAEGIEAAIEASSLDAESVRLTVLDDGGDAELAAGLLRSLSGGGTLAVIGPLDGAALGEAARARSGTLPLVSPTAWQLPEGEADVFSLAADDREGARALAEWAMGADLSQVVVLHPAQGPGSFEARFFEDHFLALGGSVLRSLAYDPGAAFFREQMETIRGLRPQALVLTTPPEDVQALASQAAFFALDTLQIQLVATGGWADPTVLAEVDPRYLDGVVVAAPVEAPADEGRDRFVEAYEARFQRTLTRPDVAALGYDAASIVLQAVEAGARTPQAVAAALRGVQGLPGATGVFSVREGSVTRTHELVCLAAGRRLDLGPGERPVPIYRPYEPDPETGIVPEGPGHPAGFICPSLAPADSAAPSSLPSIRR